MTKVCAVSTELARMPIELLNEIFVQLRDDDISDLLPVALVSRHFYRITMPLIYQTIQIDISDSHHPSYARGVVPTRRDTSPLVTRLSAGPSIRALVKNIQVFGREGVHPNTLRLLLSWLPEFSQLKSFSWDVDGSFPTALLEGLAQHCPRLGLHMRTQINESNIRKDWDSLKLPPTMIRSLQICMPSFQSGRGNQALVAKRELFWVLRNCPGLQTLSTYGCVNNKYRDPSYRRRPIRPLERGPDVKLEFPLPQLLELSIADSTFETDDLLSWGANEGWAKLKKITLWDDRLLYSFHGCEHSLRSIHLIDARPGYEDALGSICLRTTRLTELKVETELSRLPFSVLEICGSSLRTLAVHPYSDRGGYWTSRQDVSLAFLLAVQRFCPGLTNFASNLCRPSRSLDHLSILSQMSQLAEITLHIIESRERGEDKSFLAVAKRAFLNIIGDGGTEHNLKSLTLQNDALRSDWDNPWGDIGQATRVFQAKRSPVRGGNQGVCARQIRGGLGRLEQHKRNSTWIQATQETMDYLNAMPPAILAKMIEANGAEISGLPSGIKDSTYEIQTSGWTSKLAEYEESWKNSSGILPLLEWQLQKRKTQGWKLWDMPLMTRDAGSEGFLYDRMTEAGERLEAAFL